MDCLFIIVSQNPKIVNIYLKHNRLFLLTYFAGEFENQLQVDFTVIFCV